MLLLRRTVPTFCTFPRLVWTIAAAPIYFSIYYGQIYLPLMIATLYAMRDLEKGKRVRAALLIGVVIALKPNFGLWPLFILAAGYSKPALVAYGTAAVLTLLPLVRYPPAVYQEWIAAGLSIHAYGLPASIGQYVGLPWVGPLLYLLVLAGAVYWVRRRRADVLGATDLSLGLSLLLFPWSGPGYFMWIYPGLLRRQRWGYPLAAALLTFLVLPTYAWPWYYIGITAAVIAFLNVTPFKFPDRVAATGS